MARNAWIRVKFLILFSMHNFMFVIICSTDADVSLIAHAVAHLKTNQTDTLNTPNV